MSKVMWSFALMILLGLNGCSAVTISRDGTESVKGIPFYTKKGMKKHTEVISRTWLDAKLELCALKGGKREACESAIVRIREDQAEQSLLLKAEDAAKGKLPDAVGEANAEEAKAGPKLSDIVNAYSTALGDAKLSMKDIFDETKMTNDGKLAVASKLAETVISKETATVAVADYSNKYYYNARVPVFGSAGIAIKLAGDGTINEASANLDTTKLADVIPLKEILSKAAGISTMAAKMAPEEAPKFSLEITYGQNGYLYTKTALRELNPTAKQDDTTWDSVVRTKLNSGENPSGDSGKGITFKGAITLPKNE